MQVGIGHGDGVLDHLDDQHVCVVGADIVLDQQPVLLAGRSGLKARVVQLERRGAVHPPHEGAHAQPVLRPQLPAVRAVDLFAGNLHRQLVEVLVQVHDEDMKAVALVAVAVRQLAQSRHAEAVLRQRVQPVVPPRHARLQQRGIGVLQLGCRARQHCQIVFQQAHEAMQFRDHHLPIDQGGRCGHGFDPALLDACGAHFTGDVDG